MHARELDSKSEAKPTLSRRPADVGSERIEHPLLTLQRRHGNRYVQRVVGRIRKAEREAKVASDVEQAIERARGGGQRLDNGVQAQMEPAFGTDFSGVRVHADAEADRLSRSLNARAFTSGQDIFFRQGAYSPGSLSGRELLAHELTHVVQQTGETRPTLIIGQPGDRYEREADRVARAIIEQELQADLHDAKKQIIPRQGEEEEDEETGWYKVESPWMHRQREDDKEDEEAPVQPKAGSVGLRCQVEDEEEERELARAKAEVGWASRQLRLPNQVSQPLSSVPAAIQRNGGTPSNIERLDEMLNRWNVPEEEVIALLGRLTADEKSTVLRGRYKSLIAAALNISEMVRAVNNLAPPLRVKLEWVEAAAGRVSSIDYSDIRSMITSAPPAERNALNTMPWREFFVAVCTNETIFQAVNDLGFDLATKLDWIRAEMTSVRAELSYSDIRSLITSAPQAQRNALNTTSWREFFVAVCTNETIVQAVNDLGFDLATKLDWIRAEMTSVRAELSYSDIRSLVTSAPQAQRNALRTDAWRDFFVLVCTNDTMAEAVVDLGWPLQTQLEWMIAEGTDYTLVKARIQAAPVDQKNAVLGNRRLLRSLKGALGWNDFAKSVELLGRQAPTAASLLANATVQAAMTAAWNNSNPAVPGPGTNQHEEGGWIYLNLITEAITTRSAPAGGQAALSLGNPPTVADSIVVGDFHTHPNLGPGWVPGPSGQDNAHGAWSGVPGLIRSGTGDHSFGPARRLHLAGSRGFPGASGGDAPQAKRDGSYDRL